MEGRAALRRLRPPEGASRAEALALRRSILRVWRDRLAQVDVGRVLQRFEERDLIVKRTDMGGKTSITLPALGWTTAAA